MNSIWLSWTSGLVAFVGMVVVTPLVIWMAQRKGWVAQPRENRWHKRPTALMGGIALCAAATPAMIPFIASTGSWLIVSGAMVMFLTGLIDDLKHITPVAKLVAQVVATALLLLAGYAFGSDLPFWISIPLTFFWVIGITNALNLLDNMDGLAAGVAAIAATLLAIFAGITGDVNTIGVAMAVAGAAFGFLVFNFNPARIFMGDSGSLFLGYMVAALSLVLQANAATSAFPSFGVYLISAAVLAVPIFDTTLVSIARTYSGRPISEGGRDHSSHRLVFLGLTEREAVLMLYGVSLVCGGTALLFFFVEPNLFYALCIFLGVGLGVLGVHLGRVNVYKASDARAFPNGFRGKVFAALHALFGGRSWKLVMGVGADLLLVVAAFILAYHLRFEEGLTPQREAFLVGAVPIVVVIKILVFFGCGLYRSIWRHAGTPELIRIIKATIIASLSVVVVLGLIHGFGRLSRGVFLIDWMIVTIAVTGVRFGFRGLRQYIASRRHQGKHVLLYGAGDAGLLMLRELRQNIDLGLKPVGFIDDDPLKQGMTVQGISVLGSFQDLKHLCRQHAVEEVLITASRMSDARKAEICTQCAEISVPCRMFTLSLEPLIVQHPMVVDPENSHPFAVENVLD